MSSVAGSTSQRVGADVRMLYAIGELDDFELLKKEISESHFLVAGVEARVRERLRAHKRTSPAEVSTQSTRCVTFQHHPVFVFQNLDLHTYRELSASVEQLKRLTGDATRLASLFWLSQLPVRDEFGNFVDLRLLREVSRA